MLSENEKEIITNFFQSKKHIIVSDNHLSIHGEFNLSWYAEEKFSINILYNEISDFSLDISEIISLEVHQSCLGQELTMTTKKGQLHFR